MEKILGKTNDRQQLIETSFGWIEIDNVVWMRYYTNFYGMENTRTAWKIDKDERNKGNIQGKSLYSERIKRFWEGRRITRGN